MRSSRSAFFFGRTAQDREHGDHLHTGSRSSFDVLLRPNKRHADGSAVLGSTDLEIAQELLHTQPPMAPEVSRGHVRNSESFGFSRRRSSLGRNRISSRASQTSMLNGQRAVESAFTSGTWTIISDRMVFGSSAPSSRNASSFASEYNRLAQEHGLPHISHDEMKLPDTRRSSVNPNSNPRPRSWLFRKLVRKASSRNMKGGVKRPIRKRISISEFVTSGRSRRGSIKTLSLEEIARVGGVSIFILPPAFIPGTLVIPSCLAATGTYIFHYWRKTSGIFRVPGSFSTINALFDYFTHEIDHAGKRRDSVQKTVSSGSLPDHISYSVDDVASVFKKFLSCLPGGILGSVWLFDTFNKILAHDFSQEVEVRTGYRNLRAELAALAIACLESSTRISVICAVFGLLASIASEGEAENARRRGRRMSQSSDKMGHYALGIVFGPLLLGNMTEDIPVPGKENEEISPGYPENKTGFPSKKNDRVIGRNETLAGSLARAGLTLRVTEMLIMDWVDIVAHLGRVGALEVSSPPPGQPPHVGIRPNYTENVVKQHMGRPQSMDVFREGLQVRKTRTQKPVLPHMKSSFELQKATRKDFRAKFESGRIDIKHSHMLNKSEDIAPDEKTPLQVNQEELQIQRVEATVFPGERPAREKVIQGSPRVDMEKPQRHDPIKAAGDHDGLAWEAEPRHQGSPRPLSFCLERFERELNDPGTIIEQITIPQTTRHSADTDNGHVDLLQSPELIQTPRKSSERSGLDGSSPANASTKRQSEVDTTKQLDQDRLPLAPHPTRLSMLNRQSSVKEIANKFEHVAITPRRICTLPNPEPIKLRKRSSVRNLTVIHGIPVRESSLFSAEKVEKGDTVTRTTSARRIKSFAPPETRSQRSESSPARGLVSASVDQVNHVPYHAEGYPPPLHAHIPTPSADRSAIPSMQPQRDLPTVTAITPSTAAGPTTTNCNTALYAEIQRLQRLLDIKTEEVKQMQRQLDAMRTFRNPKPLGEPFRDARPDVDGWRGRAERRVLANLSKSEPVERSSF